MAQLLARLELFCYGLHAASVCCINSLDVQWLLNLTDPASSNGWRYYCSCWPVMGYLNFCLDAIAAVKSEQSICSCSCYERKRFGCFCMVAGKT